MENVIWILSWQYYDGSAYGVVRAYLNNEKRARADLELLSAEHNGKEWRLTRIPQMDSD
jgi:hypothetical protein